MSNNSPLTGARPGWHWYKYQGQKWYDFQIIYYHLLPDTPLVPGTKIRAYGITVGHHVEYDIDGLSIYWKWKTLCIFATSKQLRKRRLSHLLLLRERYEQIISRARFL